ncbi:MAG: beta strand repeat-containing protein, partial [Prosthecobacter sp.]
MAATLSAQTPTVSATKVDTFTPNGAGKVLPGAPIQYTTTIANTGSGAATGVNLADAIPANTALVPGSVNVSPLAEDNVYSTIVNTQVAAGSPTVLSGPLVTSAVKVTDNDREFLTDTYTISVFDANSANGGSVAMVTSGPNMGSFTYVPPAGFVGSDSFTYTLRDDGTDSTAGNADDLTGIGTVVINVIEADTVASGTQKVWYIDSSYAGANGTENGTSARPFNALSDVTGATGPDVAGDTLFVAFDTPYTGGITLLNDQTLWGEGAALVLNGITLVALNDNPVITNAVGAGITLATNNTIRGMAVGNTSTVDILGTAVGNLTISDTICNGTGGIITVSTSGVLNVAIAEASTSSAASGISLTGCSGTFTAGAVGSISGVTGTEIDLSGGSVSFTYSGAISSTSVGSISIASRTSGNVSLPGNLNITGGTGISCTSNSGGTITFGGATKTITTGTNPAVTLTNNTGATVNFTGGGLALTTTIAGGFTATGGGTVSVTGANNTLTTTTGTALNVANTTIGASGLTFRSISSNGAANGIVLNTTGSSGGLTVTGTGSAGSGGTIQSCTSHGLSLTSTAKVNLSWMNLTNNLGSGISGGTINGFLLDRLSITGNGNDAATDESGINLAEVTGSAFGGANPTGITNSTISNNNEFEVQIVNTTGTLTDFRLTSNTISSNGLPINGNATSPHGNLVNFLALGTASMTLTASGGSYTGNWNPASPPATITATALHIDHSGTSGTMTADVSNASFTNNNVAVNVSNANGGNLVFDIHDNPTVTGSRSHGLNLFVAASATGSVLGKFRNNVVGTLGTPGSASELGFGIRAQNEGVSTALPVTLLISGNTVQQTAGFNLVNINLGIAGQATTKPLNATITGNTLRNSAARAITIQQNNNSNATSAGTVAVSISGNTFSGNIGQAGDGTDIRFRKLDANGGVFNVTQADVNSLAAANGLTPSDISVGGTVSFNQPAPPQPLLFAENLPPMPAPAHTAVAQVTPVIAVTPVNQVTTAQKAPESHFESQTALTAETLEKLVIEAKTRWEATGLSEAQKAALQALRFEISDLNELHLGQAAGDLIQLSRTAAGNAWFIDETPSDDSEFESGLRNQDSGIQGVDLLTTLMHEIGHRLGLPDSYDLRDRSSIMYGYLTRGERRLPVKNQALGASVSNDEVTRFLGATINIGTLPAGKSVTIVGTVLVNDPANTQLISSQGTVSGSNFTSILTDDPAFAGTTNPTTTPVERPDAAVQTLSLTAGSIQSAAFLSWQVIFDVPVSGLTAANFTLVNGGLGGSPA